MIRIDEIYFHTMWPWIQQNIPGFRLLYCYPFGNTNPDSLYNFGTEEIQETDFAFLHDQEPVDIELYADLFDKVIDRVYDIQRVIVKHTSDHKFQDPPINGHVIVSEKGENVEQLCSMYGFKPHYYFYHGWACLDWFRGYDRTFLIARARERYPTQTFISPNRIVAGRRDHRVLFLYHVFKNQLESNWITAPRICVEEDTDISQVASKYCNIYPDIEQVLTDADLPRVFPGEDTQKMSSCWLTNFDESADSLVYVPTETVYFGRRLHLTEKTFKAIALEMPFVLVAPAHSLEYLRSYGFKTFDGIFDESYDEEEDDYKRLEMVAKLLKDLDELPVEQRQEIHRRCLPIVEYNYEYFYHGGFANHLWPELVGMLNELRS
jgi:hypothetical protein